MSRAEKLPIYQIAKRSISEAMKILHPKPSREPFAAQKNEALLRQAIATIGDPKNLIAINTAVAEEIQNIQANDPSNYYIRVYDTIESHATPSQTGLHAQVVSNVLTHRETEYFIFIQRYTNYFREKRATEGNTPEQNELYYYINNILGGADISYYTKECLGLPQDIQITLIGMKYTSSQFVLKATIKDDQINFTEDQNILTLMEPITLTDPKLGGDLDLSGLYTHQIEFNPSAPKTIITASEYRKLQTTYKKIFPDIFEQLKTIQDTYTHDAVNTFIACFIITSLIKSATEHISYRYGESASTEYSPMVGFDIAESFDEVLNTFPRMQKIFVSAKAILRNTYSSLADKGATLRVAEAKAKHYIKKNGLIESDL